VQVAAGFVEVYALGIGAWQFLDERDVALGYAAKNCSELKIHEPIVLCCDRLVAVPLPHAEH
jgi:hypothetical protein